MKLLKIEVRSFGKLKDFVLEPGAGLNTYCRPNEFGKSTLISFLYFMLYGYDAKRLKNYFPWSGEPMSGVLLLREQGRQWRIERLHPQKGASKRSVFCIDTGEELKLAPREQPGPRFLGLDGDTFLRSFCITQGDLLFTRTDGLDVALKNMAATGDENVSFRQAEEYLHKQHARYLYRGKSRGPLLDLEDSLSADRQRLQELSRLVEEQLGARSQWEALGQALELGEREIAELQTRLKKAEGSDALKLLRQLEQLKQSAPTEKPAVEKEALDQWARAYAQKEQAETAAAEAAKETLRCREQLHLLDESLGRFGFHARSAQEIESLRKKKKPLLPVLLFAAAIGADVLALVFGDWWYYAIAGGLLLAGIGILVGGRLARRQICHRYGAADARQLIERWAQYGEVKEQRRQLDAQLLAAVETENRAQEAAKAAGNALERLRMETRILSPEELQAMRIQWGIYESGRSEQQIALQEQALLGGRSRAELEALAEGAEEQAETAAGVREQLEPRREALRALRGRREALDVHRLEPLWEEQAELRRTVEEKEQQLERGRAELAAIQKSLIWLQEANEEMNTHFAPRLCSLAGEQLEKLTGGRYRELLMNDKFEILLAGPEGTYPIGDYSAGTRDAVYFAFRLAVSALLSEKTLPMVLDDPFVNLDEERRAAAERLLEITGEERQILYFTCRE